MYFHNTKNGIFLILNEKETIQQALLKNGQFENLATKIAVEFAGNFTIIDVGSNIGTFSIPVARQLQKAKIISIEPQLKVFFHFCTNILINNLENIKPINIAIGKTKKKLDSIKVPIFDVFTEKYTGSVSLDPEIHELRKKINSIVEPNSYAKFFGDVSLRNLDDIVGKSRVTFIKIDVEGMEYSVLKSAEKTLIKLKPFIFFEAWNFVEFEFKKNKLTSYVKKFGYELIRVGEDYFAYHHEVISSEEVEKKFKKIGLVFD